MSNNEPNANVVEFVRLGQKVSNHFRVRIPNRATFDAVMRVADTCNEFRPDLLAETFGELFDESSGVEYGAEGSTVLYVNIPYYPNQRMRNDQKTNERYTDEQRIAFAQKVIDWAKSVHADEISGEQFPHTGDRVWNAPGDKPIRVRIWWD